nr:MAG TPA: hypothetical protein [Caudoviricetes sp.]
MGHGSVPLFHKFQRFLLYARKKFIGFQNMTRCIYNVSYFLWLNNFFSYARFFENFMEQWHGTIYHKAFSDLKYGTAHGTMAHGFKIYGTRPCCYWSADFHLKNNFILNFSIQILI